MFFLQMRHLPALRNHCNIVQPCVKWLSLVFKIWTHVGHHLHTEKELQNVGKI